MGEPNKPSAVPAGGNTTKDVARTLTFFGFFAMTASMVMTVYGYPTFASSGLHLVFFLIVGGILWFLPVAMCSAEMSTVEGQESGGIFAWVGNMLGERWGFAALFYQWIQITVGFVTMCFFVLAALSYILGWNALDNNPFIMFIGVAVIVWGLTLTQLGGTKLTAIIARVGFIFGIVVPVFLLVGGVIAYFATGGTSQLAFGGISSIIPDFSQLRTLVIFASFVLGYMGVESSASHINELQNPNRNYPMVMIVLCLTAIVFNIMGGLSVALTLDRATLDANMSFGVIQAFETIYQYHFNLTWVVYLVAVLLALGVLAEISAWIVGPSHALLDTAKIGIIPPMFAETNKNGVSVRTVVLQGIIVTFWDAVLCASKALSGGSGGSVSYLTAIGLTVVIYLIGYVLFFLAYFKLTLQRSDLKRFFQLPGGTAGKCIIAGIGMIITVGTLIISFFPSSELSEQANKVYETTLAICFVIVALIPFIIYSLRSHWNKGVTPGN
ncbi:MAG: amino acid permease [Phascolarctobacterium sp.]|nr:amino acid permease [Phascolarctobacterium sp.]